MTSKEIKTAIGIKAKQEYERLKPLRAELDRAGVYVIKAEGQVIYVGESSNLLKRFISHQLNTEMGLPEHKYDIFRDLIKLGKTIECEVIEECSNADDRFYREAYWIYQLNPILNVQRPYLDNPKKYWFNSKAKTVTAQQIIDEVITCHWIKF